MKILPNGQRDIKEELYKNIHTFLLYLKLGTKLLSYVNFHTSSLLSPKNLEQLFFVHSIREQVFLTLEHFGLFNELRGLTALEALVATSQMRSRGAPNAGQFGEATVVIRKPPAARSNSPGLNLVFLPEKISSWSTVGSNNVELASDCNNLKGKLGNVWTLSSLIGFGVGLGCRAPTCNFLLSLCVGWAAL